MFREFQNKPLAMLPQDARAVAAALNAGNTPAAFGGLVSPGRAKQSPRYEVLEPGIALITVWGAISNREDEYTRYLNMPTYQGITRALAEAMADPAVQAILFDFESGGGVAAGVYDAADAIFTARRNKPVWALVDQHAFSAAYCLASAAEKVFLSRTGGVGSIGVICLHLDASQAEKEAGFKITEIFSGSHKADFSLHRPLADAAARELQAETDRLYQLFVASVARYRGLEPAAVAATEAGLFWGNDAVAAGLADGIATREEVLARLAGQIEGQDGGGGLAGNITLEETMSKASTNNQAPPAVPTAGGEAGNGGPHPQAGQPAPAPAATAQSAQAWTPPPPPDMAAQLAAAKAEGAVEATARINGIMALDQAKANPELAQALAADASISLESATAILKAAGPAKAEGGAAGQGSASAQPGGELAQYMARHAPDVALAPNVAAGDADSEEAEAAAIIATMNAHNGKGVTRG